MQRVALYAFCIIASPVVAAIEVQRNFAFLRLRYPAAGFAAALRMYWLALWAHVPPVEYVTYDFEQASRRQQWASYLYWIDSAALKSLNDRRGAANADVQDKVRFAQICQEHALPHAGVLRAFRGGDVSDPTPLSMLLPKNDAELWVKPISLQGSRGAESWLYSDGILQGPEARTLRPDQFLAHLLSQDCLLQYRLRNHPELENLSNGSLASLRLVTCLHKDGRTSLIGNILMLPRGAQTTSAGGIRCVVGPEDGKIIKVLDYEGHANPVHPDTQIPLLGRKIPCWNESLDLVSRAHTSGFPKFATLGWDVALTPHGPLLLEANSGWDALTIQAEFGPLGSTAFSDIVVEDALSTKSAKSTPVRTHKTASQPLAPSSEKSQP